MVTLSVPINTSCSRARPTLFAFIAPTPFFSPPCALRLPCRCISPVPSLVFNNKIRNAHTAVAKCDFNLAFILSFLSSCFSFCQTSMSSTVKTILAVLLSTRACVYAEGMSGKFRNLSNRPMKLFWKPTDGGRPKMNGWFEAGGETSFQTYTTHEFFFSEVRGVHFLHRSSEHVLTLLLSSMC